MAVVRLAVITGPTGAGKSAVAMTLAAQGPVTVVSADSRQVYRGFDIGTAKPSAAERAAVPHACIDMADADERISAARWVAAATEAIDAARRAGRTPLVVGGTGLYLRALFEPLFREPALEPAARAQLEGELALRSTEDLRREVAALDPERAHLGRTQLLRAIEIARLTGRPISAWHRESPGQARFAPAYLVVERGVALGARLVARTAAMFDAGWIEEVRHLVSSVPEGAPAWNATGYDAVRQVVRGETTLAAARHEIVVRTRQYAKRQRTWFRHQLPPDAVTAVDLEHDDASEHVRRWWRAQEST
ncbi:MAG: tRNA (adenosine(37)-N6)-dimethylallyltransferase MiaA [Gemmatimonadaceae bacterium]|nr:tRNA (adenosine(37)-N6)-dimethylallyltransferase MiaA [Gemmatimonadaceae bacterium]